MSAEAQHDRLLYVMAYEDTILSRTHSLLFFFFKQKTAYDMLISDWSSDVCSSDLPARAPAQARPMYGDIPPYTGRADAADGAGAWLGAEPPEQRRRRSDGGRSGCGASGAGARMVGLAAEAWASVRSRGGSGRR